MAESRDYLELSFRSIKCFADDGKLDIDELNTLVDIALGDGNIDDNEKRVLSSIFARLNEEELTEAMQSRIQEIKERYF